MFIAIRNRFWTHPFSVNSLPKAGTHLVAKAVSLFPGIRWTGYHLGRAAGARLAGEVVASGPTAPVGVGSPLPVPVEALRRFFRRVKNGSFVTAHLPYSAAAADLLVELGIKSVLILRDPRDVVVSHANHVAHSPQHPLFEMYVALAPAERIMTSIRGVPPASPGAPHLLDVAARHAAVLPWTRQAYVYTTHFERLVGPRAGGSAEAQVAELGNIATHLGIRHRSSDLGRIAESVYGGTSTFRKGLKGQIGGWRGHFSAEHCTAFKEVAGQMLIDLGYERDLDW